MRMKKGFTLVEFLVVIGILGLSVGSIMLILTTVVKGVNQTNIQAEVKQNGQNVLDSLTSQIRNATDIYQINGQTVLGNQLVKESWMTSGAWIWLADGTKLTLVCANKGPSITENGQILIHTSTNATTSHTVKTDFAAVSNKDTKSGVDVVCTSDSFHVSTSSTNAKVLIIDYTVNQGVEAPSRVDFKASAQFKTAISLRQYQ